MVWEGKLSCKEFALYADICNLVSGFLAADYMALTAKTLDQTG